MADIIAQRFCQKHGFDMRAQGALTAEINKNIESVLKSEEHALTSIEELDGPSNSRYITNALAQKSPPNEENISVTESL